MARTVLTACLALLVAGCQTGRGGAGGTATGSTTQTAAEGDARREVSELLREYRRALADGDAAAAGRIWADDLLFINYRGEVLTKAQRLENLRSGATAVRYLDVRDETLRVYGGDTAITSSLVTIEGRYGGRESSGTYRSALVWAKPHGHWRIVSVQMTRVAGDAPTTATTAQEGTPEPRDGRMVRAMTAIGDVELSVQLPSVTPPGEPVVASIALDNRGAKAIGYWSLSPTFEVEVRDAQGRAVPTTAAGDRVLYTNAGYQLGLKAGTRLSEDYDLSRWFDLRKEGVYSLTVTRPFNEHTDDEWGTLEIKELYFFVGPQKNPFRTDDPDGI
jgi:uncharacterized protein (TIGR02246 family)